MSSKTAITSFSGEFEFLSNFYMVDVFLDGILYPSTEHAYQAAKTFDQADRKAIREATTPGRAKRLGAKVDLRDDWEDVKIDLMGFLLTQKFLEPELAVMLLATRRRELVEGNNWGDRFWGVYKGKGENHLGKTLMEVRRRLLAITKLHT